MRQRCILLLLAARCLAFEAPEIRGVWLDRSSLTSREEIRTTLANTASANFNVVFVNAWSRGYPLWHSQVFERETGFLTDPGFQGRDVLREVVEEARQVALEVIPWIEYGFIGGYSGYFPGEQGRGPIFDRHPDWLARKRDGESAFPAPGGSYYWMVHARPEVQEFLISMMVELVRGYDIPGIQFDRARYPGLDCGYDEYTVQLYAGEHDGANPPDDPADSEWVRWRSEKLNRFVGSLYRRVKAADWRSLVTNAPGTHRYAYVNFAQDYPAWVRENSLDFVVPQIYRRDAAAFEEELVRQMEAAGNSERLVPGLDSTSTTTDELIGMIQVIRERNLPGFVVWYYRNLLNSGALDRLKFTVLSEKSPLFWRVPEFCDKTGN